MGVALGLTWGTLALIFSGLILDVFFGTLFKGCLIVFDVFVDACFKYILSHVSMHVHRFFGRGLECFF